MKESLLPFIINCVTARCDRAWAAKTKLTGKHLTVNQSLVKIPETSGEWKIYPITSFILRSFFHSLPVAALLHFQEQGSALKVSTKCLCSVKEEQGPQISSGLRTKKVMETNEDMETYCELSPLCS